MIMIRRRRRLRTQQERLMSLDGWARAKRNWHNIPNDRDEFWIRPQRSWKWHRQHQWKVKDGLELQDNEAHGAAPVSCEEP